MMHSQVPKVQMIHRLCVDDEIVKSRGILLTDYVIINSNTYIAAVMLYLLIICDKQ